MTSIGFMRSPPRYSCSTCNKLFRRRKQKDDHILFNRCRGLRKQNNSKTVVPLVPQVDPELVSMKDELVHYDGNPYEEPYIGRPYNFVNIPTGNRHLRAGLPFANDPLRRKIQPKALPKSMASLGPIPTLSKHIYGLQAI